MAARRSVPATIRPRARARRLAILWVTIGALACVALSGPATAGAATPAAKPVTGGTWTIGLSTEIASMDPVRGTINSLTQGGDRLVLVFGTLMRLNTVTGEVVPGLAESLTTTDAQTWVLKLRPKVTFSDGTPLDADAVIFNMERFKNPANAFTGIGTVSQISKMTKLDPLSIEFKLSQPNGSFNLVFVDTAGQMGSPAAINADPRNWGQKPVGAGPFLLKEWVRDRQYTFVRNPTYFDKPRPYIDQIVVKIIPDQATLTQSLQAGTIDAIQAANQPSQFKLVTDDPKKFQGPDPEKSPGAIGMSCNLDKSPCNDIRYREALSLAFDFKVVKEVFLPGMEYPDTIQCPPFGPGSPLCAKDVKVKFNPTRAKKLVDEVKADGINTDLVYTFNPTGSSGPKHGEFVQQQLAKIGIKVSVIPTATSAEYVQVTNNHTFQAAIVYNPTASEMGSRFYNDWHSVGGPNGGRDVALFNNASLDVALEKSRNSLKYADRVAGYVEAQRIIAKQFLVAWFIPTANGTVASTALRLPSWTSKDAPIPRLDDAWIKPRK